jgi:N utilization substance protein A
MMDLKSLKSAVEQLVEERGLPAERVLSVIEDALAAAYKKDYGKKSQIIRAKFDPQTGGVEFWQVKTVVDEAMFKEEDKINFNEEHHIKLEDARKIKNDVLAGEELTFPLPLEEHYGRIAAQTAKQVILQRLREAEKQTIMEEFSGRAGQIVAGKVQRLERGNIFVDLGRATGLLSREEQLSGEYYRQGERIKAYLSAVEETPRGVNLRLSRAHPKFVEKLFEMEVPEMANSLVEVKALAREAGSRTKIAVSASAPNIDPVGACVGQRGVRVNTVINELGGEKIDIMEWSDDYETFITNALSPAKIKRVTTYPEENRAEVEVEPDQFSLAVGRGGQNARLAAKLTGWKIDIISPEEEER